MPATSGKQLYVPACTRGTGLHWHHPRGCPATAQLPPHHHRSKQRSIRNQLCCPCLPSVRSSHVQPRTRHPHPYKHMHGIVESLYMPPLTGWRTCGGTWLPPLNKKGGVNGVPHGVQHCERHCHPPPGQGLQSRRRKCQGLQAPTTSHVHG